MDANGLRRPKIRSKIKSMRGIEMESEAIFVAAFKYIYKAFTKGISRDVKKHKIKNRIFNIKDICDIQWVLTVPAIWDDAAKDKMKEWMHKAGLTNKNIKNHCILKYEPDCASISLQNQLNNTGFVGKKYILIDSGGGTVDIACHEFLNDGVKELHY